MDRSNPYEAAFEAYLQAQGLCYVGVDEARRSQLDNVPIKNLDFVVLGKHGAKLLVDVKGRQFPGGPAGKERFVWESWTTQDDIDGIEQWQRLFGPSYLGLFVFLYRIKNTVELDASSIDLFRVQDQRYLLRAVPIAEYRQHVRVRSPKWGTVNLPSNVFARLARPFRYFTHEMVGEPRMEHGTNTDEFRSAALAPLSAFHPCSIRG